MTYAQTTFLNFTYFLSYNRANLIGAGDYMLSSIILNGVVFIIGLKYKILFRVLNVFVGLWPEGILATGKRR